MLTRVLEAEVMDSPGEAADYDAMDHGEVNRLFVADFLRAAGRPTDAEILDIGTGTAQIPIELVRVAPQLRVLGVDLAASMLELAGRNVERAGLGDQIALERVDAKRMPYRDGRFAAVISNSIVHHIPEPRAVLAEAGRVLMPGGLLFVRDLMRPADDQTVRRLVDTYAAGANRHQRELFEASLRAALSLDEIRGLVVSLGHEPESVEATSDRHWTVALRKVAVRTKV